MRDSSVVTRTGDPKTYFLEELLLVIYVESEDFSTFFIITGFS